MAPLENVAVGWYTRVEVRLLPAGRSAAGNPNKPGDDDAGRTEDWMHIIIVIVIIGGGV